MKIESAIKFFIGDKVEQHVRNELTGHKTGEVRVVKLMALAEGYAMVRRKGCMPYICQASRLKPVEQAGN